MASKLPLLLLVLCSLNVAQCVLTVYNLYAKDLRPDPVGAGDGYVRMTCIGVTRETSFVKDEKNPSWPGVEYTFPGASAGDQLEFQVYDKDVSYDDLLGSFTIIVEEKGANDQYSHLETGGTLFYSYKLS